MSEQHRMSEPYDLSCPKQRQQAAGEYVLNTLSPDEKASFEALMAFSPDLQQEVQQWREHLQVLDSSLKPVPPPAGLWQKIEQEIQPARKSFSFSLRFWQLTSLISLSCALVLMTLLLLKPPMINAHMADHLYVVNNPERTPAWLVNASVDRSHLMVQTIKPATIPEGKVCRLWLKLGDQYVMAGVLPHSGLLKLSVPAWMQSQLVQAELIISVDAANSGDTPDTMGAVVDQGGFMPLTGSLRRF